MKILGNDENVTTMPQQKTKKMYITATNPMQKPTKTYEKYRADKKQKKTYRSLPHHQTTAKNNENLIKPIENI
jgi:hypothetical protein